MARAMKNALVKVEAFEAAHARAKAVGVPASFPLACDRRRGYDDYRGGIPKPAFIRYGRYHDPPFKLLRMGQLRVKNPRRWLAEYRQRRGPIQKLFLNRHAGQSWQETARARLGWAVERFETQRRRGDPTGDDQVLSLYWEMRFLLHFARAAKVGDEEILSAGPPSSGDQPRPTLAQVKRQLPLWERQMRELAERLKARDRKRWRGHLARLTGDKAAIFNAHCLRRLSCRISDGHGVPDRTAQASIWVFEDQAYGDAYTGFYKAYRFRGDAVIDELTTKDSPVPPSANWVSLRRAAKRLAPTRPILTPAE